MRQASNRQLECRVLLVMDRAHRENMAITFAITTGHALSNHRLTYLEELKGDAKTSRKKEHRQGIINGIPHDDETDHPPHRRKYFWRRRLPMILLVVFDWKASARASYFLTGRHTALHHHLTIIVLLRLPLLISLNRQIHEEYSHPSSHHVISSRSNKNRTNTTRRCAHYNESSRSVQKIIGRIQRRTQSRRFVGIFEWTQ